MKVFSIITVVIAIVVGVLIPGSSQHALLLVPVRSPQVRLLPSGYGKSVRL